MTNLAAGLLPLISSHDIDKWPEMTLSGSGHKPLPPLTITVFNITAASYSLAYTCAIC